MASVEGDLEGVREGFWRTCGDARSSRETGVGSREAREDASVEGGLVGMRASREKCRSTRGVSEDLWGVMRGAGGPVGGR